MTIAIAVAIMVDFGVAAIVVVGGGVVVVVVAWYHDLEF